MASISRDFRFVWRGQAIAAALEAAVEEAMEQTAAAAEADAKARARVKTGAMRDSIGATVERRAGEVSLTLGIGVSYGLFHELGTARMSAQPMIRPALDSEAPKLPGRIRAAAARLR